ncbi:hypothetical protein PQX77_002507 [Marasmius sp. AFHP31]|nr:hypothetical protein PQX77_002507 [Marasmius sp. AFHP31]
MQNKQQRESWETHANRKYGVGQGSSQYMASMRDEDMIYTAHVAQARGMECDLDTNLQQDERMLCDEWNNEEDDLMDAEESHHEVDPAEGPSEDTFNYCTILAAVEGISLSLRRDRHKRGFVDRGCDKLDRLAGRIRNTVRNR